MIPITPPHPSQLRHYPHPRAEQRREAALSPDEALPPRVSREAYGHSGATTSGTCLKRTRSVFAVCAGLDGTDPVGIGTLHSSGSSNRSSCASGLVTTRYWSGCAGSRSRTARHRCVSMLLRLRSGRVNLEDLQDLDFLRLDDVRGVDTDPCPPRPVTLGDLLSSARVRRDAAVLLGVVVAERPRSRTHRSGPSWRESLGAEHGGVCAGGP